MKNRVFYALLGVALAAPAAAFAGEPDHSQQSGHYKWKSVPQYGPRATDRLTGASGCPIPRKWQAATAT
jgi:hypothetical protein